MPKADAKNQMLKTVCQKKKPAENQIIKKCKHDLSSISTQKVMKDIKKNEREK